MHQPAAGPQRPSWSRAWSTICGSAHVPFCISPSQHKPTVVGQRATDRLQLADICGPRAYPWPTMQRIQLGPIRHRAARLAPLASRASWLSASLARQGRMPPAGAGCSAAPYHRGGIGPASVAQSAAAAHSCWSSSMLTSSSSMSSSAPRTWRHGGSVRMSASHAGCTTALRVADCDCAGARRHQHIVVHCIGVFCSAGG